jgi:hypothetical protein
MPKSKTNSKSRSKSLKRRSQRQRQNGKGKGNGPDNFNGNGLRVDQLRLADGNLFMRRQAAAAARLAAQEEAQRVAQAPQEMIPVAQGEKQSLKRPRNNKF